MEHQDGVRGAEMATQMTTSKLIWEPSIQFVLWQHKESRHHIFQAFNCPFLLMVKTGVRTRRMEWTRYNNYIDLTSTISGTAQLHIWMLSTCTASFGRLCGFGLKLHYICVRLQ